MVTSLKMELQWSKRTCDRCGGDRLAKRPCPECGARPRAYEIQPDLDRRRRLVQDFRAGRRSVVPVARPEDVQADFVLACGGVFSALAAASRGGYDASELWDAFERLDQLEANMSIPELRPHLNRGRALLSAIRMLGEGMERFLDALAAEDIDEAQRLEASGQAMIESAVAELEPNRHELLKRSVEEGMSPLEAMGRDHAGMLGVGSLQDLQQRVVRVTGLPGQDFSLHLAIEGLDIAAASLDRERYLRLSEAASTLLEGREEILDDADVLEGVQVALLLTEARQATLLAAIEAEEDDLTLTGLALDLVKTVRERGLRAVLVPLVAAALCDSIERVGDMGSGSLLKRASAHIPELELDGLDRLLRDSAAHEDYHVENGLIVLDQGRVRLTPDELLDRVLEVWEFFTGMARGLFISAARAGMPLPEVDRLPPRVQFELVRYFTGLHGLGHVNFEIQGRVAALSGVGMVHSWPGLVAALSPLISEEVLTLEGRFEDSNGDVIYGCAELEAYRALSSERPEQPGCCAQLLKFLPVFASTRYEDTSPIDAQEWLSVAVHVVCEHVDAVPLIDRLRRGREVLQRATQAGVDTRPIKLLLARMRNVGGTGATPRRLWHVPLRGDA